MKVVPSNIQIFHTNVTSFWSVKTPKYMDYFSRLCVSSFPRDKKSNTFKSMGCMYNCNSLQEIHDQCCISWWSDTNTHGWLVTRTKMIHSSKLYTCYLCGSLLTLLHYLSHTEHTISKRLWPLHYPDLKMIFFISLET